MAAGLAKLLRAHPAYARVLGALKAGMGAKAAGLWGSSQGLFLAALVEEGFGPFLAITAGREEGESLASDARLFGCAGAAILPEPEEDASRSPEWMRLLGRLLGGDFPPVLVAPLASLCQALPVPGALEARVLSIETGDERPPAEVAAILSAAGLLRVPVVSAPCEFAVRGGVLDFFPAGSETPFRLDYLGDEIETIAEFDPETQASAGRRERIDVLLGGGERVGGGATLLDYAFAGGESCKIKYVPYFVEPEEIGNRAEGRAGAAEILAALAERPGVSIRALAAPDSDAADFGVRSLTRFEGSLVEVASILRDLSARVPRIVLFAHNEGEEARIRGILADAIPPEALSRFEFKRGHLARGFETIEPPAAVLGHQEVFHRYAHRRPVTAAEESAAQATDPFGAFSPGDRVVHEDHGIGIFRGIVRLSKGEGTVEHLAIEYDGGARVLVPPEKASCVSRYVGPGEGEPALHVIGGTLWGKIRERVAEATEGLAKELLEVQAARASAPGFAFPANDALHRSFEAAFLYPDTPDQQSAWNAIRRDLEAARPMDRLLCGDVGFGKTELAIRAAFKAASASKQTAVLVPTTILAEQHRQTFAERFADFPARVEMLSRFVSGKAEREVLEGLASGAVDVVIGTHRILQPDVRFKDLGLVVVDEEQRFGVQHKERLKALRASVDVLTMTATPIPRTLHMALLGLRDVSNLKTAPPGRQPIETKVVPFDPARVRSAIRREIERDGQCFFVHNRVQSLPARASEILRLVPEARLAIAHGQMAARELESKMLEFLAGRVDVLCCTTIIESGIDVPNANTIFIDRADCYGLADLHQLRGRVGRYMRKAHAYLLLSPGTLPSSQAALRLKALEEFSELGSGFRISLRDLEIRGAGNLLGSEQHGHIASVGYALYMRLLEDAVRRVRGEPPRARVEAIADLPVAADVPETWLPEPRLRIDLYRRLAEAEGEAIGGLEREMADRYGEPPPEAVRLVRLARLRERMRSLGIRRLGRAGDFLRLAFESAAAASSAAASQAALGRSLRMIEPDAAVVALPDDFPDGEPLLALAERLLGAAPPERPRKRYVLKRRTTP